MKSSDREFIDESEELLEEAVGLLLNIQDSPSGKADPDALNALFRAMHTLKGMSGIYGFQGLTDLSHALESLLDDVRMGKAAFSDEVMSFLFSSIDVMKSAVRSIGEGRKEFDPSKQLKEIESFRESLRGKSEGEDISGLIDRDILKVLSEYEEHRLRENIKEGRSIYLVFTAFSLNDFDIALKELNGRLKSVGEIISTMPTSENVSAGSIGFKLIVGSSVTAEEIRKISGFQVKPLLRAGARAEEGEEQEGPEAAGRITRSLTSTVRVDIEKIDGILSTIEEISLVRSSMKRIWAEFVEQYGYTPLSIDIYKVNQNFERRIAELQHQVLEIRMVPIGQMFRRLTQTIRRYAREADKKIFVKMYGEDTELDKYLVEEVMDPLVQIVRNAIDHGLEDSARRLEEGKPEAGTITLKAFQSGNSVVIEVRDDGVGIDMGKVRKKAEERGFLDTSSELSEKEVLDVIFMPGFSTRDTVSEVSGRGVGLDIVKEKISIFGGTVGVSTRKGSGSTFTLTLPITLAIIKSLMVRAGTETFAVPLSSMSETISVRHDLLQKVEGRKVLELRGEMLPMVKLSELLEIPDDGGDKSFGVVIGSGDRSVGLMVDELNEQYEVVIKPLGGYMEDIRYFAGAAEIGKHEVIMVLDAESIIDECISRGRGGAVNV